MFTIGISCILYSMKINIFTLIQNAEDRKHDEPVVLVHGSWGASWMWNTYIQFLSQSGWDVYALDLRGHGKSEGEVAGATMQNYVEDVRSVVEENNLNRPVVIGHSMGGLVALMYTAQYGEQSASAVVAIDPSPTKEISGSEEKTYPDEYSPVDSGMPTNPMQVIKAFPDIEQRMLIKMKDILGMESGIARSERKAGISIKRDAFPMPVLFVGSENGESVPFGIGIRTVKTMADYYDKEVVEIKGATHPGILMGKYSKDAVMKIDEWISLATQ